MGRRTGRRKKEPVRKNQNIIGPSVLKLRLKMKWTQEQMVARAQCAGFDLSRQMLANIETRRRGATIDHLQIFVKLFRCTYDELFPPEYRAILKPGRQ